MASSSGESSTPSSTKNHVTGNLRASLGILTLEPLDGFVASKKPRTQQSARLLRYGGLFAITTGALYALPTWFVALFGSSLAIVRLGLLAQVGNHILGLVVRNVGESRDLALEVLSKVVEDRLARDSPGLVQLPNLGLLRVARGHGGFLHRRFLGFDHLGLRGGRCLLTLLCNLA